MGRRNLPLLSSVDSDFQQAMHCIEQFKPDVIYHSPLKRAVETKDVILRLMQEDIESVECKELIERNFGDYEGRVKSLENRLAMEKCDSVETLGALRARIKAFLRKMLNVQGRVLVIGHSSYFKELKKVIEDNSAGVFAINCCEAQFIEWNS